MSYITYKARVESDGGYIVDQVRTQALFDFLNTNNISETDAVIAGANYGVKAMAGVVIKLYSINGNDFIPSENNASETVDEFGPWILNKGSYHILIFDSIVNSDQISHYFIQENDDIYADIGNGFCFYFANALKYGTTYSIPLCFFKDGWANSIIRFQHSTQYTGTYYYQSANPSIGTSEYSNIINFGTYAQNKGASLFYDVDNYLLKGYDSGSETIKTNLVGQKIFNIKNLPMKMGISVAFGASITKRQQGKILEIGAIKNGTAAQALAISNRLNGLYV